MPYHCLFPTMMGWWIPVSASLLSLCSLPLPHAPTQHALRALSWFPHAPRVQKLLPSATNNQVLSGPFCQMIVPTNFGFKLGSSGFSLDLVHNTDYCVLSLSQDIYTTAHKFYYFQFQSPALHHNASLQVSVCYFFDC